MHGQSVPAAVLRDSSNILLTASSISFKRCQGKNRQLLANSWPPSSTKSTKRPFLTLASGSLLVEIIRHLSHISHSHQKLALLCTMLSLATVSWRPQANVYHYDSHWVMCTANHSLLQYYETALASYSPHLPFPSNGARVRILNFWPIFGHHPA